MLHILLTIIGYSIVTIASYITLYRRKQWKASLVAVPVLVITFVIQILIGLNIDLPSPLSWINSLFNLA